MRLHSGGCGGDPRDQTGAEGTSTPKLHRRSGRSGQPAADNQRVTAPQSLPSGPPSRELGAPAQGREGKQPVTPDWAEGSGCPESGRGEKVALPCGAATDPARTRSAPGSGREV